MAEFLSGTSLATLADIINTVMDFPMYIVAADKSIAFRCRLLSCDQEIARYTKVQSFTMASLSRQVMGHIKVCTNTDKRKPL